MFMQTRLSKLQKVILVYVGVKTKQSNKSINRRDVTKALHEILGIQNKESFSVVLTFSINALVKRKLVSKRGKYVNLTDEGREVARAIINDIKSIYGDINWEKVRSFYGK